MKLLARKSNAVDDLDKLLLEMFGKPAPPQEEILRHKWLESEKAGRDIGVVAAAHDWRIKYYARWKEFQAATGPVSTPKLPLVSRHRLEVMAGYILLPLAAMFFALALLQWSTGVDYTDYISGRQLMRIEPPQRPFHRSQ